MKKIFIIATMAIGLASYAQQTTTVTTTTTTTIAEPSVISKRHEVKIGAVKLLAGPILEGTYEYIKSKDFTFGASVLYNFDNNTNDYPEDFSITPFARFYFQETKEYGAKGFFVEGFGKYTNGHDIEYYYNEATQVGTDHKEKYDTAALGLAIGWKLINHSGFVFELLAGAGRTLGGSNNVPDAIFRGDLNIGYRF